MNTRDNILNTAAKLLAKRANASLTEIASAAEIGRATLHRHFASREDLMHALAQDAIQQTNTAVAAANKSNQSAEHVLYTMLSAIIPLGDRFHFLMSHPAAQQHAQTAADIQRQQQKIEQLVIALKWEKVISNELPNAWVTNSINAMIHTAWSAIQTGHIAAHDAPKLVLRSLLKGLKP